MLLKYRIGTALIIGLMVFMLSYASVSFAKTGVNSGVNVEKKQSCIWYKSRAYFTDASHTTQVGIKIWYCDGLIGRAGTLTNYWVEEECDCDPEG
jgi:hypothetical protein